MDLLSITPSKTAKFKFVSPSGEAAQTESGTDMFVEIYGSHTREFQSALLEKHQRTVVIWKSYGYDENTKDEDVSKACRIGIEDAQTKFLCDITVGVLIDLNPIMVTDPKDFYSNDDLEYWIGEVSKFADDTGNFIPA